MSPKKLIFGTKHIEPGEGRLEIGSFICPCADNIGRKYIQRGSINIIAGVIISCQSQQHQGQSLREALLVHTYICVYSSCWLHCLCSVKSWGVNQILLCLVHIEERITEKG